MALVIVGLLSGEPMNSQLVADVLASTGSAGAVLYLFYKLMTRMMNHTIPRLAQSYTESSERQREDFKEMIDKNREYSRELLANQAAAFSDALGREREALERMSKAVDKLADKVDKLR